MTANSVRIVAPLFAAVMTGCTFVRPVHVDAEISSDKSVNPSGVPISNLDYFKQKYPPESWKLPTSRFRIAVGPMVVSTEAHAQLSGDGLEVVEAKAQTGTSQATLTIRKGDRDVALYIARTSLEVQAIVAETLAGGTRSRVYTVPEDECRALVEGHTTFQAMYDDGIRYYVDGTVVAQENAAQPAKVYLRFTDTGTREIVCAVSSAGSDLASATRDAASALVQRLK